MEQRLAELISITEIPSLPEAARIAVTRTLSMEKSAQEIASIVKKDPSLTLKLLKLANSSFYSRGRRVSSVRDAVIRLGYRTVKSLILSISISDIFSGEKPALLDYRSFWLHSVAAGVIAEELNVRLHLGMDTDLYSAGLLHDVGKVLLMMTDSGYARVVKLVQDSRLSFAEAERRVLGFDHTDAATFLFRHWNLPEAIVEPVSLHHSDLETDEHSDLSCYVVTLANQLAHLGGFNTHPSEPPYQVSASLVQRLGLTEEDLDGVLQALKKDLEPFAEALNIPRSDVKGYFEVLSSANRELGRMYLSARSLTESLSRKERLCGCLRELSLQFLGEGEQDEALSGALRLLCTAFSVEAASFEVYLDRERSAFYTAFVPLMRERPSGPEKVEPEDIEIQVSRAERAPVRPEEPGLPILSGETGRLGMIRYREREANDPRELRLFSDHLALGLRNLHLHQTNRAQAHRLGVTLKHLQRENGRARRLQKINELVLETSPVGVLTLDADGAVIHWNAAAESILQENPGGKQLDQLGCFSQGEISDLTGGRLEGRQSRDIPVRRNRKQAYLHLDVVPIEGTDHTLVLITDITSRFERERIIIQKEKMATLGELAAGIAHNLRSPLAVVKGIPELILSELNRGQLSILRKTDEGEEPDTEVRENLELINRSLEKTFSIIDSIMEFSKQETGEFEEVPLETVIEEVRLLTEHKLHGKSITFTNDTAGCVLQGNRNMLIQIFINLVNNSLEAVGDRGTIEVKCWQEQDRMIIHFADDGRGISEELLDKVFEPFFTTSGKANGTGIGLSVTRRMVTLHGGSIKALPRPEGGTIMEIIFPHRNNRQ
ncbi:MAG: HDOD domain-containing protein [Spirochaetota bacterium]